MSTPSATTITPPVKRPPDVGVVRATPHQALNLLAGQLYFGHEAARVKTLLGSCVGITLWHPQRRLGGMCHFLLPERARTPAVERDGRFGEEAMHMLVDFLARKGTQPQDYEAHLYGGADTMPDNAGIKFNVGERNIERAWQLIDQYGFSLQGVDVGDNVPRTVELTLASGEVSVRRGEPPRKTS